MTLPDPRRMAPEEGTAAMRELRRYFDRARPLLPPLPKAMHEADPDPVDALFPT